MPQLTTSSAVPPEFIAFAHMLADAARPIIAAYFGQAMGIETKADKSPVTMADREAEAALRGLIKQHYPTHGIIGEEFGAENHLQSEWAWVLDPVDGTKAFATGRPTFGTLIGLMHHNTPVLGICDNGIINTRYVGVAGMVSTCNGQPMAVRPVAELNEAIWACTNPLRLSKDTLDLLHTQTKMAVFGGDCQNFCLLAKGLVDVVVETQQQLHDLVALQPIIEGAGGVLQASQPLTRDLTGYVTAYAAATPTLLKTLL